MTQQMMQKMNKLETFLFLADTATKLAAMAKEDYESGNYESAQSRLTQISILLDRMRAITRDTAAGIN